MATRYLSIDKFGELYTKATEGTPGAYQYTSYTGAKYWRVHVKNTIQGKLSLYEHTAEFQGKEIRNLNVKLENDKGDVDILVLPFFDGNGRMGMYAQNVILSFYHNQEHFDRTDFSLYPSKKKKPNGYLYNTIFINYGDRQSFQTTKEQYFALPDGVEKTIAGKKVWDFTDRDNALYEMFKELEAKYKETWGSQGGRTGTPDTGETNLPEGNMQAPSQQQHPQAPSVENTVEAEDDGYDDLPF